MNEEMVPGEGEITETDAAELEREMAGADPALSATPGADVAGEIEIESINIDGVDIPISQVMDAYRGNRSAQQEAQEQSRNREELSRAASEPMEYEIAPDSPSEPAPQPEVVLPRTPEQDLRVEEYLLLNEVEGLKATHGDFDEDAVFETMVNTEIDDVETALFVTRGKAASMAANQGAANAAADGVVNAAGTEAPSSSSIVSTETPDVEGKSWGQVEREAASDVSRRGASILS
jgi:cytoskeletal protein RodZ